MCTVVFVPLTVRSLLTIRSPSIVTLLAERSFIFLISFLDISKVPVIYPPLISSLSLSFSSKCPFDMTWLTSVGTPFCLKLSASTINEEEVPANAFSDLVDDSVVNLILYCLLSGPDSVINSALQNFPSFVLNNLNVFICTVSNFPSLLEISSKLPFLA